MSKYLPEIKKHLETLIFAAAQTGGGMWPSVVSTLTGRHPEEECVPQRVYRLIGAPQGSTLYWDQPLIVAADALSELTGHRQYIEAADNYIDAFLSRCVADNGMFRWGNHAYYDLSRNEVVEFHNGHHELRPITPAWDIFWRHAPEQTETYIRKIAERHIYDPATGGFNRHDDGKKGHAFLEAGGIICESLAWLQAKTSDNDLLDTALQVARYSYSHRDSTTGLVPNEPDFGRWDSRVSTSEIGLWTQCLLRTRSYTGEDEFLEMARDSILAYLDYAFDSASGRFFGQVDIHNGKPVVPEHTGYWPRQYAEPWNTNQWPTHDYPMAVAETCLSLHSFTGERALLEIVRRWAAVAVRDRPGLTGKWAYAEAYGRCIHFLTRTGLQLGEDRFLADAQLLADEAIERLWENDMFQGYPQAHLYESVDGVGFLILALIFLETRQPVNMRGFGF